ncbi:MAG: hypothetical protein L7S57_04680 [Luminiphilus sp.]|nr:hypothetical protein [Luminiphilus sp.]
MYDNFLGRLSHLRKSGQDRWRARCPAHDSDGQSLALAIADDGRLLIKCFAGCGALDVLTAVGCGWEDCFPEDQKNRRSLAREFDIKPAGLVNDRIVELAAHTTNLTAEQAAEAERAALRGGKPDGFCKELGAKI